MSLLFWFVGFASIVQNVDTGLPAQYVVLAVIALRTFFSPFVLFCQTSTATRLDSNSFF